MGVKNDIINYMAKYFETKKVITNQKGEQVIEITRKQKTIIKPQRLLKQIQGLDESISKFQAEKIKLQEMYDEITN